MAHRAACGLVTLAASCLLLACKDKAGAGVQPGPRITIAAAANLTDVFQVVGTRFEAATGIRPVFSFASTAQLTQQIENSAPFDVITAADATHVEELDRKGLLLAGSRAVYARGILALWIPPGARAAISRIEDLDNPAVRFIAIAKPELAPYGQATLEALQHVGLWTRVQAKIVYAENINAARQYGMSGNADAVFTAYSLLLREPGKVIPIAENLHQPIDQELGIIASSKHLEPARKFVDFLLHGEGRAVLLKSGYAAPGP
ncbi:MAG TPA: molybdate ABC transporter substrate-binding protein [Bryobacteraceae bacterium]|nr:molybdate ABC transporter substrate-binding protein [Bryobacteraceae bacterium]